MRGHSLYLPEKVAGGIRRNFKNSLVKETEISCLPNRLMSSTTERDLGKSPCSFEESGLAVQLYTLFSIKYCHIVLPSPLGDALLLQRKLQLAGLKAPALPLSPDSIFLNVRAH